MLYSAIFCGKYSEAAAEEDTDTDINRSEVDLWMTEDVPYAAEYCLKKSV